MPNKINLEFPPAKIRELDGELYSYIYKLIEQLNVCLSAVDQEQISGALASTIASIDGLGKDLTLMGSSTSMALVSAMDRIKQASDEQDRELRVAINAAAEGTEEKVSKWLDATNTNVEAVAGSLSAYKLENDEALLTLDELIRSVRTALDDEIRREDERYTALAARVSALEAPTA